MDRQFATVQDRDKDSEIGNNLGGNNTSGRSMPPPPFQLQALQVQAPFSNGGVQQVSKLPTPMWDKLGSKSYYKERNQDFIERYPEKTPPKYYLEYGDKYIHRFSNETKDKLSDEGQKWLEKALYLLQFSIENELKKNPAIELDEDAFQDFIFDSHVPAYEAAGILTLGVLDKLKVGLTPDPQDLFSEDGIRQAKRIALDQVLFYNAHPIFALAQAQEAYEKRYLLMAIITSYIAKHKKYFKGKEAALKLMIIELYLGPWAKYFI